MATNNQNVNIIINAINKSKSAFQSVEKSFTKMQFQADRTRKKLEAMKPAFKKMAQVGTVAFAGLTAGILAVTNKASDFEEATNKFNVVFKEVGNEADAMAKKLNDSYGLSLLKSKELLSGTGDLLTGFGFTGKKALELSSNVNTLAVDLASFTNAQGGAEAVSNALTKALLGETESLKTYGIAIKQSDIEAELLAKGMGDLTGEALRQAKAQTTLELAYKQSKNAIGDYERSAGSLAQSKKELKKTFEDMSVELGGTFMPLINDIVMAITPLIQKFTDWVKENPKMAKGIILVTTAIFGLVAVLGFLGMALIPLTAGFTMLSVSMLPIIGVVLLIALAVGLLIAKWDEVKIGLLVLGEFLIETWTGIKIFFEEIFTAIGNVIIAWVDGIKAGLNALKEFFVAIFTVIKNIVMFYFNTYKTIVETIITGIKNAVGTLKDAFKSVFDWINENVIQPFMKTLEKVIAFVEKIIRKMQQIGGNIGSGIKGLFGRRASGGSVDPSKPFMVGEKGPEMFVPNSFGSITPTNQLAGAGGGVNITFTGNSFMGDDDMVEKVGDQIIRIIKDNTKL